MSAVFHAWGGIFYLLRKAKTFHFVAIAAQGMCTQTSKPHINSATLCGELCLVDGFKDFAHCTKRLPLADVKRFQYLRIKWVRNCKHQDYSVLNYSLITVLTCVCVWKLLFSLNQHCMFNKNLTKKNKNRVWHAKILHLCPSRYYF